VGPKETKESQRQAGGINGVGCVQCVVERRVAVPIVWVRGEPLTQVFRDPAEPGETGCPAALGGWGAVGSVRPRKSRSLWCSRHLQH